MKVQLGMEANGKLTWCIKSKDNSLCPHIGHKDDKETKEEFVERMALEKSAVSQLVNANNLTPLKSSFKKNNNEFMRVLANDTTNHLVEMLSVWTDERILIVFTNSFLLDEVKEKLKNNGIVESKKMIMLTIQQLETIYIKADFVRFRALDTLIYADEFHNLKSGLIQSRFQELNMNAYSAKKLYMMDRKEAILIGELSKVKCDVSLWDFPKYKKMTIDYLDIGKQGKTNMARYISKIVKGSRFTQLNATANSMQQHIGEEKMKTLIIFDTQKDLEELKKNVESRLRKIFKNRDLKEVSKDAFEDDSFIMVAKDDIGDLELFDFNLLLVFSKNEVEIDMILNIFQFLQDVEKLPKMYLFRTQFHIDSDRSVWNKRQHSTFFDFNYNYTNHIERLMNKVDSLARDVYLSK